MSKYRKKPIVIEAEQFNWDEDWPVSVVPDHCDLHDYLGCPKCRLGYIHTLEGIMTANDGDWIITGVKGEKYPCKPDIFEATYELVEAIPSNNGSGVVPSPDATPSETKNTQCPTNKMPPPTFYILKSKLREEIKGELVDYLGLDEATERCTDAILQHVFDNQVALLERIYNKNKLVKDINTGVEFRAIHHKEVDYEYYRLTGETMQ